MPLILITITSRNGLAHRQLTRIAILDRQPLKEDITSLIKELHNHGYVHGDLRNTNLFVGNNTFMLLDFDWAGRIEEARYPMYLNREDIRRPNGASDGEKIVVKHDLDILECLFDTEEDGWETAAKRRRISSGEGSAMDIA
jgi:serine/threonine protein kinase